MPQELRNRLSELREHLQQSQDMDDSRRQELDDLALRIETMMNEDVEHWEEHLVDQLEQRVIQYQEEHPVAAGMLREVMVALSNMGL